jgi:gamma-glutamyltranspeptidase/glutathione hydrolase
VAAWFAMLERYGTLPASELLQPAIEYAEEGFPTGYFLSGSITRYRASLEKFPHTVRTFLPQGRPPQPFEKFRQPRLAQTLRRLAWQGPSSFYEGELAQAITRYCTQGGSFITENDLAEYRPEWKTPLQTTYHGYTVYGQPPVSQGHVLLEALNILANDDLHILGRDHPDTQHLLVEATRLAFADRYRLAGDPAFVDWPLGEILSQKHTRELRQSIKMEQAGMDTIPFSGSRSGETTYFAVADRDGNWVSFIQSLFHAFGSGEMLEETGILLNDRMVGFSLEPASPNCLVPGKRPVHTLNACLLMKNGRPYAALGTPGSDGQVQTNLQLISNLLDHDIPVQAVIEAPRWRRSPEGELSIEDRFSPNTLAELERRGHQLKNVGGWSDKMGGAQAIVVHPTSGVFMGGADPRREGYAVGW